MNLEIQEAFIKDHQTRFSSETIRSYRLSLRQFFTFCEMKYDEMKAKDIRGWLANMYK